MRTAIIVALASIMAWAMAAEPPLPRDYLSPELRAEVEALKREARTSATDVQNLAIRARVMSRWIDAYSLAGGHVSLGATGVLRYAVTPPAGDAAVRIARDIDGLIAEFRMRDEEPRALGRLEAENLGPFPARSYQELRQTYVVGERPIRKGGGFWVARHMGSDHTPFQTDAPAADGWVTIASTDPSIRFEPATIMADGPHGGFRQPAPALVFRLAEGELAPDETVTITYGDQSRGSRGLQVVSFSTERMPLPVYVDLDGSGYWYSLPLNEFVVVGTQIAGVHGFAPSIVGLGETFELAVRAEDAFANRATGPIPAFHVLVDGKRRASTREGTEAIQLVELSLREEGPHWITLRSADGRIEGHANPVLVQKDPPHRIYWGDTHGHSGYAEGIGTMDYYMRFARDDARLDYITHSEHDVALDAWEWEQMRAMTQKYQQDGRFVAYLGYEWTTPALNGGHHNVLFRTPEDRKLISALEYPTLSRMYKGLRDHYEAKDVVVIPHAHNPGDYRYSDPDLEPLIEVMSMHGTFEWFAHAYLAHGHQVGFVAASDDHTSHPGYSTPRNSSLAQRGGLGAVFAPERTRDAIFAGLRESRTYATTGDRIILEFAVNDVAMGQRAPFAERRRVTGRAIGTAPIESVTLFKNEQEIWRREYVVDETGRGDGGYLLTFYSETFPYHRGDAPRGWRHWRGTLAVEGASITSAVGMDFLNETTQHLRREGDAWSFATNTRGDTSSVRLTLADVTPDAALVLRLEDAAETGGAPPLFRPPRTIPGGEVRLSVAELQRGQATTPMTFDGYADAILLRRLLPEPSRDVAFEYTDEVDPRHGDHYFVRVRQLNDALAWSSPVWVGGYRSR